MSLTRKKSIPALLFGFALVGILAITLLNVLALVKLHRTSVTSNEQYKKNLLTEITYQVRSRFFRDFDGLSRLEMQAIETRWETNRSFPEEFQTMIANAEQDALYDEVYFTPVTTDSSNRIGKSYRFDARQKQFIPVDEVSTIVSDALQLTNTRVKALLEDYQYNNKVIFDTHRSMNLALIIPESSNITGYLTLLINRENLVSQYLQPLLRSSFSQSDTTQMAVWLHDWTRDEVLAASHPDRAFTYDKIDLVQKFPGLLDNWNLKVEMVQDQFLKASRASLHRNLTILGITVLLLGAATVFIFITAQRERNLAKQQTNFLANITHELKTPLSLMQAAGENLSDGRVSDPHKLSRYGTHILRESQRLRKMIDLLLDAARADAGKNKLTMEEVSLPQLLQEYLQEHREMLKSKGFSIDVSVPADEDPVIDADPDAFHRILDNLLDNAVKYSPDEKFIALSIYMTNESVHLQISDHGIGISTKEQKHIFEKFYRVENANSAQTKGHGLGLAIVKQLVEEHRGTIRVESEPGQGTTIDLAFPLRYTGKCAKGDQNVGESFSGELAEEVVHNG